MELDRTLDVVVSKLVNEGWTLPAELPIAAVNALGKTTELDDVNTFMADFYSYDDQRNMKSMINKENTDEKDRRFTKESKTIIAKHEILHPLLSERVYVAA